MYQRNAKNNSNKTNCWSSNISQSVYCRTQTSQHQIAENFVDKVQTLENVYLFIIAYIRELILIPAYFICSAKQIIGEFILIHKRNDIIRVHNIQRGKRKILPGNVQQVNAFSFLYQKPAHQQSWKSFRFGIVQKFYVHISTCKYFRFSLIFGSFPTSTMYCQDSAHN